MVLCPGTIPALRSLASSQGKQRIRHYLQGIVTIAGWSSQIVATLRKLEVHIAVRGIDTRFLQKCSRQMEHLKLSPRSRRAGIDEGILRPTENGINANLLRGNVGNRDVLRQMPEISNVRLDGQAFAKILRIRLQNAIAGAVAAETE